jgi:hypothetical protein
MECKLSQMGKEGMGTFPMICFVLNNYEKGLIYLFFYLKKKMEPFII